MSLVRFVMDDGSTVEYALTDARAPAADEEVEATGDDPEFPAGTYMVVRVRHVFSLRGGRLAICWLRLIAQPEFEPEDAALGPKTLETEVARLNALAEDVAGNQTKGK